MPRAAIMDGLARGAGPGQHGQCNDGEVIVNNATLKNAWRRMSAVSRRGSIRLLGAAALTGALAAPAAADKSGKKKGAKRCKRQRGQCLGFVREWCQVSATSGSSGQPQAELSACEEQVFPCCEHFSRCNAGQGLECVLEKVLVK